MSAGAPGLRAIHSKSSCAMFDNDVPGEPPGNTDARAQHANDERIAGTHDFNFAADAETHRHEPVQCKVVAIDAMNDGVRAGGQLVESMRLLRRRSAFGQQKSGGFKCSHISSLVGTQSLQVVGKLLVLFIRETCLAFHLYHPVFPFLLVVTCRVI